MDTTGDLRYAKIYISALDKGQEKDMMKGLRSAAGYLRRELGAALRLRYTGRDVHAHHASARRARRALYSSADSA